MSRVYWMVHHEGKDDPIYIEDKGEYDKSPSQGNNRENRVESRMGQYEGVTKEDVDVRIDALVKLSYDVTEELEAARRVRRGFPDNAQEEEPC